MAEVLCFRIIHFHFFVWLPSCSSLSFTVHPTLGYVGKYVVLLVLLSVHLPLQCILIPTQIDIWNPRTQMTKNCPLFVQKNKISSCTPLTPILCRDSGLIELKINKQIKSNSMASTHQQRHEICSATASGNAHPQHHTQQIQPMCLVSILSAPSPNKNAAAKMLSSTVHCCLSLLFVSPKFWFAKLTSPIAPLLRSLQPWNQRPTYSPFVNNDIELTVSDKGRLQNCWQSP